jgi:hypothetical protein
MKRFHVHTPQTISCRRWMTFLAALAGACLALLPQGLYAHGLPLPPLPPDLEVPAGHRPFLLGHATGTQNYMCLPSDSGFVWVFVGPQATLFNDNDRQIITHFLSPNPEERDTARATWQHSRDASMVWAKQIASYPKSNFVELEAIPWLLLEVVGADIGPAGGHRLTKTTYIQRVHTSGGLAPTTGCTQASEVRKRAFVPYTADYIFYKASERE